MSDNKEKIEELEGRIAALELIVEQIMGRIEIDPVVQGHRDFVARIRAAREASQ